MSENFTIVQKVRTSSGYPFIKWTDTRNQGRSFWTLYRRTSDGFAYSQDDTNTRIERRGAIVAVLKALDWHPTRGCLASAPWLRA